MRIFNPSAGRASLARPGQDPPQRLPVAKLAICGAFCALGLQAQPFTVPGAFTAVPAGNGHLQVVTGDVNRDGKLDVVTLSSNGTVSVLLGAGNGTFALGPGSPIAGFTNGTRIALVDVNLDGKLDLKAEFSNGNTGLWNGDGAGGFVNALGGGVGVGLTDNAVADFNGDNIQDAVFAGGSILRVFQGVLSGNSLFFIVGPVTNAQSVAVGDFNGDRKIDIAVSSSSATTVAIFLGNGDYTFTANGTVAVPAAGAAAGTLRSGDFNNDGKVDLALLVGGGRLAILLGNGSGGFSASAGSPVQVTGASASPGSLELADMDGDGNLDAIVGFTNTSASGGFSVYRGNGSGGFSILTGTPLGVNGTAALAAVGDFNNDGKPDIAASESGTVEVLDAKVRIFLNNLGKYFFAPSRLEYYTRAGSTTVVNRTVSAFSPANFFIPFASTQPWLSGDIGCGASCITVNPSGLAPGRFSGRVRLRPITDGFTEGLLASLQVSRASGGMTSQTFTTGTDSQYPNVADFNNDGKLDLAVTNNGSNNVTVLLGNGAGGFSSAPGSPFTVGTGPIGGAAGDFNGDGKADLAIANNTGGSVSILLGLGTGGFGPSPFPTLTSASAFDIATGDFNRDGKLDLSVASNTAGTVTIFLGTGSGTFAPLAPIAGMPLAFRTAEADFNQDGLLDLAVATSDGAKILLGNGSGGFTAGTTIASSGPANDLVVGDWNGDGKQDVAVGRLASVAIFLGDGAGLFTPPAGSPIATSATANYLAKADLNGDGNPDVIVSLLGAGNSAVLLGNGSGGFTLAPGPFGALGGQAIAADDFDGNGFGDFAVAGGSVTVVLGAAQNTTVALTHNQAANVLFGTNVTFTATVSGAAGVKLLSNPGGTVEFFDGAVKIGEGTLNAAGVATLQFSTLAPGAHANLTAKYLGNSLFNQSTSTAASITIGAGTIAVVGSATRSTTVGTQFSSLQVKVTNANQAAVAGITVTFTVPASGATASLSAATAVTDAQGLASVTATANTTAGTYSLTASIANVTGTTSTAFQLTNTAGPAAAIAMLSGSPQSATVGAQFTQQLRVKVTDANGNAAANATVTFTPPASGAGASLSNTTVQTDEGGLGGVTATANSTAGSYSVTAAAAGVATGATFALTNLSGSPGSISATGGTPQSAVVGQAFATALQVTVRDASNNPVAGTTVTFSPPGSGSSATLSSPTAVTNASGVASVTATANSIAGAYNVSASAPGVATPVSFFLTNTAGAAGSISASSGTPQSTGVGAAFAFALQVLVRDAGNNPVAGVTVTFTAPASGAGATLSSPTAVTNASGNAQVTATANSVAGGYTVTAAAPGIVAPASFSLTNTAGTAGTIAAQAGTPQSANINAAFAAALQAIVRDAGNNPVAGVAVTFTAPASGASATLSSATAVTNAAGVAQVNATANGTAGGYTVAASAPGIPQPATFSLTNVGSGGLAPPVIVAPANNATLNNTIVTFQWNPVAGVTRYEFRLIEASTPQQFRVSLLPANTTAVYTFPSGNYRWELQACNDSVCSAAAITNFVIQAGAVPSQQVTGLSCSVVNDTSQNRLNCNWAAVAGANFYFINVVQQGTGPGGGALTVAGGQVGGTSTSLLIPNGPASAIVRACTGDGCGPFSEEAKFTAAFGNPNLPILGTPFNGESVNSGNLAPKVEFSWNRVAGDTGSNFTYRLYVQDFSRNRAALDILTTNNFYAAFFNPGTRYDALVIAIPTGGGAQRQGPPSPFLVRGKVPNAPVATEPTYGSAVDRDAQGKIHVAWTPIVNQDGTVAARNYQYFFNTPTPVTGVTTNIALDEVFPTGTFIGIIRACTTGITCVAGSETGWGPYSNAAGSEGGQALFTVR